MGEARGVSFGKQLKAIEFYWCLWLHLRILLKAIACGDLLNSLQPPSATARSTPSEETKSKCSQVAEFHYSTTPFRSTRFGCFLQETLNNVTITFRTTNALSSAGFIAIQAHSFSLKMKCPYAFSLKKTLGISWSPLGHLLVFRTLSQLFHGACRFSSVSMRSIVQAPFGFRIPTVCQASLVDTLADQLHTRSRFAELQSTCQWWKYVGALKSLGGSETRVNSQRMTNWPLLCLAKAHTASPVTCAGTAAPSNIAELHTGELLALGKYQLPRCI